MSRLIKPEDAYILKPNGEKKGPYKTSFAGGTVIVDDKMADIDDGDTLVRILPSGKEDHKEIHTATFFGTSIAGFGPHYQLKIGAIRKPMNQNSSQTIIVNGGTVQIGNHNRQEISNHIQTLNSLINDLDAPKEQKEEAKSLLKKFAEHPLVSAIVGGVIGNV